MGPRIPGIRVPSFRYVNRAVIRLENVSKRFASGYNAVLNLSLEIPDGQTCVLIGPSGCGKTTTLRMINRLIDPDSGRILVDGADTQSVDPAALRLKMGYVIQQTGLFPHMTVGENVGTVPRLWKWHAERIRKRVDELLELVGLDPVEYRDRYPHQLSGGQRQRVGFARALAADPPILLMDEPFGAVDRITRERLQHEFVSIQRSMRKTVVFVTHDIDEAVTVGDRICLMKMQAQIAQYDTPERIVIHPASEYVSEVRGRGARAGRRRVSVLGLRPVEDAAAVRRDAGGSRARAHARGLARRLGGRLPEGFQARAVDGAGPRRLASGGGAGGDRCQARPRRGKARRPAHGRGGWRPAHSKARGGDRQRGHRGDPADRRSEQGRLLDQPPGGHPARAARAAGRAGWRGRGRGACPGVRQARLQGHDRGGGAPFPRPRGA